MGKTDKIKHKLQQLGLTINQSDIYFALVSKGSLRISDLTRDLNIPRSSVYEALKGLYELGLAEEVTENTYKVIRSYDIASLEHSLHEQMTILEQKTGLVKELEGSLELLPQQKTSSKTSVRYYKGRAGARQIFWNSLRANETVYVYSEWGRGSYLGIEFYKNFVEESRKRKFKEKVLTNNTAQIKESIYQHLGTSVSRTRLSDIHLLPQGAIPIRGETLIYNNVYAQVFLKTGEISGFEIESKAFVETQRAIFEALWRSSNQA